MKKYFSILPSCPLFEQVAEKDLADLLGCLGARVATYDKNETVMAEGEPARHIGVVLSGAVQIVRVDYFGNRSIVSDVEPTEMFAEAFACAGINAIPVSVVASERSEILLIDCHRVLYPCNRSCGFHQQMIYNLVRGVATKSLRFHQKMEILSQRTTRDKLLTYLHAQAKRNHSDSFTIPFDRQALADYLEVERSGLSAEISKLRREGVLESRKNHFTLL